MNRSKRDVSLYSEDDNIWLIVFVDVILLTGNSVEIETL